MPLKNAARIAAYTLLVIGTFGLLLNELIVDLGRPTTIVFAALNALGLGILAYSAWIRDDQ